MRQKGRGENVTHNMRNRGKGRIHGLNLKWVNTLLLKLRTKVDNELLTWSTERELANGSSAIVIATEGCDRVALNGFE